MTVKKRAAKKRAVKSCACVENVNKELAKQNEQLDLVFRMGTPEGVYPIVATMKLDTTKRTKRRVLVPTFCPFCGRKYKSCQ